MALVIAALLLVQDSPADLYRSGLAAFESGRVDASAHAFDRLIELRPKSKPDLWQRGIALYYAERYDDCVDQFVSHRTVNPDDAENSVWHYLCVAQIDGHDQARADLFPAADRRIPLMEIHALFAGDSTPEAVLEAADAGNPSPNSRRVRRFYAQLYVALWYESHGNTERTLHHLERSLEDGTIDHYMATVAEVHLKRLRKRAAE